MRHRVISILRGLGTSPRGNPLIMWERLRALFGKPRTAEDDVRPDPGTARSRETGGRATDEGDSASTTGVGESGTFVGRVAGQDPGFAEETGAEVRARRGEDKTERPA